MKIHVDDMVAIIAGKYKGKTGKVLRVSDKTNRIVVEKINIRTRHIKKRPGQAGQRIQYEAPFDASNVLVICPHCSKKTRVGHVIITDQGRRKQRVCKKCKQSIDKPVTKRQTKKR